MNRKCLSYNFIKNIDVRKEQRIIKVHFIMYENDLFHHINI